MDGQANEGIKLALLGQGLQKRNEERKTEDYYVAMIAFELGCFFVYVAIAGGCNIFLAVSALCAFFWLVIRRTRVPPSFFFLFQRTCLVAGNQGSKHGKVVQGR